MGCEFTNLLGDLDHAYLGAILCTSFAVHLSRNVCIKFEAEIIKGQFTNLVTRP